MLYGSNVIGEPSDPTESNRWALRASRYNRMYEDDDCQVSTASRER